MVEIGTGWHQPPDLLDDVTRGIWVGAAVDRDGRRRVRNHHATYAALHGALFDESSDLGGDIGERIAQSSRDADGRVSHWRDSTCADHTGPAMAKGPTTGTGSWPRDKRTVVQGRCRPSGPEA